jgi:methyl-accepting chemotaxis protein
MSIARQIGVAVALLLTVSLAISLLVLRYTEESHAYQSIQDQVIQNNSLLVKSLTVAMGQGITDVTPYIESFSKTKDVSDVRFSPSRFISGSGEEQMDSTERRVLMGGKPNFTREFFHNASVLRAVQPMLAEPGCLSCHNVPLGTPLATISIRYSLANHEASVARERTLTILLAAATLIVTLASIVLFARKRIAKELTSAVIQLRAYAQGEFPEFPDSQRTDEIGQLNSAIHRLRENLHGKAEVARLISEGNTEVQVIPISGGDTLGHSLSQIANLFRTLDQETQRIAEGAIRGELAAPDSTLGDEIHHAIIGRMHNAIAALLDQIHTVTEHIACISNGDIPEKLEVPNQGELGKLREILNQWIDSLSSLVIDCTSTSGAARDGNFSARIELTRHKGEFRKIAESFNCSLDAVIPMLSQGSSALEQIAKGDLTVRIQGHYSGEQQGIMDAINAVASSMDKSFQGVRGALDATTAASTEISASTGEMAAGSQEQATQIHEIAAAMEQMSSAISESASVASGVSDLTVEVKHSAKHGNDIVEELLEAVRTLGMSFQNYSSTMMILKDLNDKIVSILESIDDISAQTNLLALNAAIEAARAGNAGRGFSVVADEVKKLAERTSLATKEVAVMIRQIREETETAGSEVADGIFRVDGGITAAERAQATLQGIAELATAASDAVGQISTAIEEQASTAVEISRNISAISSGTHDTTDRISKVAQSAEILNVRTQELQAMLDWTRTTTVDDSGTKRVRGAHLTANARAQYTSTLPAS